MRGGNLCKGVATRKGGKEWPAKGLRKKDTKAANKKKKKKAVGDIICEINAWDTQRIFSFLLLGCNTEMGG